MNDKKANHNPADKTMKLCECGCGNLAPIAKRIGDGYKKGQQKRFIRFHNCIYKYRPWRYKEVFALVNYYFDTPEEIFSVKEIAQILNRSEDAITIKAGRMGITYAHRSKSINTKENMKIVQKKIFENNPERRKQISETAKKRIAIDGHPKGFQGHHHTKEAKKKLSENSLKHWKDPNSKFNQPEFRQQISNRITKIKKSNGLYTNCKGGIRKDLGQYFRSGWEANIARYLNHLKEMGQIQKWEYEPDTFWFESIKRGNRSYTPDFKVFDISGINGFHYIEVKGWMNKQSVTKLSRMRKFYPKVRVDIIDEDRYRTLEKQIGRMLGWE